MSRSGHGGGLTLRKRIAFAAAVTGIMLAVAGGVLAWLVSSGRVHYRATEAWARAWEQRRLAKLPRRVLAVGDSFLSWWPIEHCLNTDLKRYGQERGIGMLVRAYGGFGPIEYVDQIETVLPEYKPGLVLLFYHVGNDLTDTQYRVDDEPRRPADALDPVVKVTSNGARGGQGWGLTGTAHAAEPGPAEDDPTTGGIKVGEFDWEGMRRHGIDEDIIRRARNRAEHFKYNVVSPEYVNPFFLVVAMQRPNLLPDNLLIESDEGARAWRKIETLLRRAHRACEANGAQLRIVALPGAAQVAAGHFEFFRRCKLNVDERTLTTNRPQELLRDFCRREGIVLHDLLAEFREAENPDALYWENDDHFSEAGHRLAFELARRQALDGLAAERP